MKKQYDNSKRVKTVKFEIGDGVTVKIPRHDRGAGDLRRIPGVIIAKQYESYKIRTEYGLLKGRFRTDQLQKCFHQTVQSAGWENDPTITLRSAAKKFNRRKSDVSHCNCKSGCVNGKCTCLKNGVNCTIYCHKGTRCKNSIICKSYCIKFCVMFVFVLDDSNTTAKHASSPVSTIQTTEQQATNKQADENHADSFPVKTNDDDDAETSPVNREQIDVKPSDHNVWDGREYIRISSIYVQNNAASCTRA